MTPFTIGQKRRSGRGQVHAVLGRVIQGRELLAVEQLAVPHDERARRHVVLARALLERERVGQCSGTARLFLQLCMPGPNPPFWREENSNFYSGSNPPAT